MAIRKTAKKREPSHHVLYGDKEIPFLTETDDLSIRAEMRDGFLKYTRVCMGEEQNHHLAISRGTVRIHPVEPLHVPKMLTHFLMIAFDTSILIEPNHSKEVFVTFPVEIAVLVLCGDSEEILDVFSVSRTKYTLYGEPHDGVICRYWNSPVSTVKPDCDLSREGVLQLTLKNETNRWIDVSRSIFNGYGMKIYFSDTIITMKAVMRITGKNLAETDFLATPPEPGMQQGTELFAVKKLSMQSRKFLMEGDL